MCVVMSFTIGELYSFFSCILEWMEFLLNHIES